MRGDDSKLCSKLHFTYFVNYHVSVTYILNSDKSKVQSTACF